MKNKTRYPVVALVAASVLVSLALQGADMSGPTYHVPPDYAGRPVKGHPLAIPGMIKAIDYDSSPDGAQNITFSTKRAAVKSQFRDDTVGISFFNDGNVSVDGKAEDPKQVYLGWTTGGEWLKYTVQVKESGRYRIGAKLAARSKNGTLTFSFGPDLQTGEIEIPTTSGAQPGVDGFRTWETLDRLMAIELAAGTYVMTVKIGKEAGFNIESFTFTKE